ncbi:MAG: nuclear transport factor 2 family protein [Gemmatimonadaceae bacterium]
MQDPGMNEIVELEKRYWNAMIAKDVDTAVSMSDDPCIVTGAQGVSAITNAQYRTMMADGKWELKSYEMTDVQARMITDDVAIIAYKVTEQLVVDGKPLTLVASDSSTWVKKGGKWRNSLHTEAPAGDPFGRDRAAPAK